MLVQDKPCNGDDLKNLELIEAGRKMIPRLPLLARLDGRAFHTWTRGCKRPYDEAVQLCMLETTKELVEEFHAGLGYTQSDEITLYWREPMHFDGRYQKMTSVLASYAAAIFVRQADKLFPEKRNMVPTFDCRVWQVPELQDIFDVFAWREDDAVKNSVAMAAQSVFSHRELQNKGRKEMMDMLHAKGINWNDYPAHFKRGVYVKRKVVERVLTEDERMRIPEKHRPPSSQKFQRGTIQVLDLPPIRKYEEIAALFVHERKSNLEGE